MPKYYIFPDPADARAELRADSGWNGTATAGNDPEGRAGQIFHIPDETPNSAGAELRVSAPGRVDVNLRGVLTWSGKDKRAYLLCDDFRLQTAAETPIPPTPEPEPEPDSTDEFDMSQAVVASHDCPDIRNWNVMTQMDEITLTDAAQGYAMNFDGRDTWQGVIPPGWDGPINHTVWMCEFISGVWYILPVKECLGTYCELGPILTAGQVPTNLTYYAQPPMSGYQPRVGEKVGFFVTTGDTRRMNIQPGYFGRSNVVLVPFQVGHYTW